MERQTNNNSCKVSKLNELNLKVKLKWPINLLQNYIDTGYCLGTYLHFKGFIKDDPLKILYLVVLGINVLKIR